ncbi:unnamed protein product [Withania somnifera]
MNSIRSPNISVEPISDGFDEVDFPKRKRLIYFSNPLKKKAQELYHNSLQIIKIRKHPISCIVYDSFFPWALEVAKKHGIYGAKFSLPAKIKENEPLLLPGVPCLYPLDVPGFIRKPESYPAYLAMKMSQFSNVEKADWVFDNSFQELEGKIARGVSEFWPARLIGPIVPSSYLDGRIESDKGYGASLWESLSKECLNWLTTKASQSVIYISFGSLVSLTSKQMEEMAYALIGSNMNFLWVVRDTEKCKLPKILIKSTKGEGLIVSWCNQLETLPNQAIGCFVTHCGWNPTLKGMNLGVPMVAMPQWPDQMTNAKFIDEIWKIGVRPKLDELLGFVKRLIIFFEIRKNATKWKDLAKKAVSEGGSSDKSINEFIDSLNLVY